LNTPVRYRAFLSYSHRDKAWADWLHSALETYRVPRHLVGQKTALGQIPARLGPVFRDRDELGAATDLSAEINSAMAQSMFLVVICSPTAAASRWVNEEIAAFKRLHGDARVRAIIVDGEPFSGDPATECFPESLRHQFNAAGEMTDEPAEPIAADARPHGDGKKFALSKLVAGLTGARLDELIRREQQRRNARLAWLSAGLAALVVVLSGLTWDALRQRNAAQLAQAEAQAQRTEAEFQRDEAQSLVEFMLTDLRQRLDAVGRLDVLEAVGTRLSESYAKQDLARLGPDALGRRARVQLLLGEIDNSRGNLDTALAQYQQAATTTGELLRRDPENPQRIYDHAQSVFWVGQIAWQRGDADTAKAHFTQYHDYARQLVAQDPDNYDWQMELNYGLSNLGTLALDQGDAAAAEQHFQQALDLARALLDQQPGDGDRMLNTGTSLSWLADALVRQSKLGRAHDRRLQEIALYEQWLAGHPSDANLRGLLSVAHYRLAQTQLAMGALEEARDNAVAATAIADDLLAADGENIELVDRGALAHAIAGEVLLHLNQHAQARQALLRSIAIGQDFIRQKGGLERSRRLTVSQPQLVLAQLLVLEGKAAQAAALFDEVAAGYRDAIAAGKTIDPVSRRRYCTALAGLSRLTPAGAPGWDEIRARLEPYRDNLAPEDSVLLSEAYAHSSRPEQAAALLIPLQAAGYRHPNYLALLEQFPALLSLQREP
jgi:tetratricopeptide (TPR) repeat protein